MDRAVYWKSVNEPVQDVLFTQQGFDLKKGTYLVDSTLGKPIVTGAVGRSSVPEFGIIRGRDVPKRSTTISATQVVAASTVVVILVIGGLLYRRVRSKAS